MSADSLTPPTVDADIEAVEEYIALRLGAEHHSESDDAEEARRAWTRVRSHLDWRSQEIERLRKALDMMVRCPSHSRDYDRLWDYARRLVQPRPPRYAAWGWSESDGAELDELYDALSEDSSHA